MFLLYNKYLGCSVMGQCEHTCNVCWHATSVRTHYLNTPLVNTFLSEEDFCFRPAWSGIRNTFEMLKGYCSIFGINVPFHVAFGHATFIKTGLSYRQLMKIYIYLI
jgi:hypothetical protein